MTNIDIQSLRDYMATEVMGWKIKGIASYKKSWHPDIDSNQIDMLVDKMVEDGFEVYRIEPVGSKFLHSAIIDDHEVLNSDRRLAVLLAIKAAKEAK